MNILIIYDLAMNKAILERILRMEGHLTVGAGRVEDLRPLLAGKNKFDLVMVEVLRPEVDGIRLYQDYLKMVAAAEGKIKKLPFILIAAAQTEMSAVQTVGKLKYAKEIGFFDIISKPLDHKRLKSSLARIEKEAGPQEQAEHLGDFPERLGEKLENILQDHDAVGATMMIDLFESAIPKLRTIVK